MSRSDICRTFAARLRSADGKLNATKAVIGMDGFVDSIIDVVDTRQSGDSYRRIETIATLGNKIQAAAGQSANYEFVVKHRKLGGNGPIFANALARAGLDIDYIGSLGHPHPDPVFDDFGQLARLHSLCEPGYTDAVEFADGKLLLGKITHLAQVNWNTLVDRVGLDAFTEMCEQADLVAMNNWTMLPHLGEIWKHFLTDVLPKLSSRPQPRRIFIDLADPEKRTPDDLRRDLVTLSEIQHYADVTLGLNLKEAVQVATVLGVEPPLDTNEHIKSAAARIREKLSIDTLVIHPRRGAGAATPSARGWFDGPLVRQPKLSTGAGDNFNAGFCLGQLLSATLDECLAAGCATSGYYVRHAGSPSANELASFMDDLPAAER